MPGALRFSEYMTSGVTPPYADVLYRFALVCLVIRDAKTSFNVGTDVHQVFNLSGSPSSVSNFGLV